MNLTSKSLFVQNILVQYSYVVIKLLNDTLFYLWLSVSGSIRNNLHKCVCDYKPQNCHRNGKLSIHSNLVNSTLHCKSNIDYELFINTATVDVWCKSTSRTINNYSNMRTSQGTPDIIFCNCRSNGGSINRVNSPRRMGFHPAQCPNR